MNRTKEAQQEYQRMGRPLNGFPPKEYIDDLMDKGGFDEFRDEWLRLEKERVEEVRAKADLDWAGFSPERKDLLLKALTEFDECNLAYSDTLKRSSKPPKKNDAGVVAWIMLQQHEGRTTYRAASHAMEHYNTLATAAGLPPLKYWRPQ